MSATLTFAVDDEDLLALAHAADEEGVAISELARLIVKAAVAVYRVEDRDGAPAGPASLAIRRKHWLGRRWRVAEDAADVALSTPPVAPISLGDPPPGRSALDRKQKQAAT